jgi:hypothetical protein
MAVDWVQSEPLSGQFLLTGTKQRNFWPSGRSRRGEILYSGGYTTLMAVLFHSGPPEQGIID